MRLFSLVLLLLLGDVAKTQTRPDTVRANFYSDTIHWLGLDLSQLTVYDYLLVPQKSEVKSRYCPHIIGYVRQKYPLEMVGKDFRKTTVIDHSDNSFRSFQDLNTDSLVLIDGIKNLTFDKIESLVSQYSLSATNGLALVAIVPSISRTKRLSTVILVFFDIASRSVLVTFKSESPLSNKSDPDAYSKSILTAVRDCALKFQQKIPYMSLH
jgi:hypothetical protein